jgi:hypothetical protein
MHGDADGWLRPKEIHHQRIAFAVVQESHLAEVDVFNLWHLWFAR